MKGFADSWFFDMNFWKRRLLFPKFKPVSGGKIFCDRDGNIFSRKFYGDYSRNRSERLWFKVNLLNNQQTVIKVEPDEAWLLSINDRFVYLSGAAKKGEEDNLILIRADRLKWFETRGIK